LRETLPPAGRTPFDLRSIAANYRRSMASPRFMLMSAGIGLAFCGLPLYVGSAAAYIMDILHLPETAFAWLFVPMVGGLMLGSAMASRYAHRIPAERMVRLGFLVMGFGVVLSVIYTSLFTAAVPYAVLPFVFYTFGLSLASPSMTVIALSIFPEMRGLAASMQGFIQMALFALVSGLVAPMVFGSAAGLAWTHALLLAAGLGFWEAGGRARAAGPRA